MGCTFHDGRNCGLEIVHDKCIGEDSPSRYDSAKRNLVALFIHLSLPKMLPGTNAFEISDIQEDLAEASQPDDQNVTMLHSLEQRCWKFCVAQGSGP